MLKINFAESTIKKAISKQNNPALYLEKEEQRLFDVYSGKLSDLQKRHGSYFIGNGCFPFEGWMPDDFQLCMIHDLDMSYLS